ncbi:MFS transporter, partial [Clostridium perfringens]|nr:MFS transporter [Clostridium perfringens]
METVSKRFSNYLLISSLGGNIIGSLFVLFLSSTKGFSAKEISLIIGTTPLIIFPIFFIWGSVLDK